MCIQISDWQAHTKMTSVSSVLARCLATVCKFKMFINYAFLRPLQRKLENYRPL